ncbi:MAG: Fic family protein [Marinilabiliaceae bacterium]|nr:Fic family protein [Marinilabiliaceae bacterium]
MNTIYKEDIDKYEAIISEYEKLVGARISVEDLKKRHEILFSSHSCAIEGNSFTVGDTQELKEKGLGVIPHGKTLYEAFEILDHFKAYEYILQNVENPLSEEMLKECHRILMKNTLSYRVPRAVAGEYTDTDMCDGETIFGNHELLISRIPTLLQSTQRTIDAAEIHPMIVAAKFHGFYEYLHPFRDGNGRIGRLFSNLILLKMKCPMMIIDSANRQEYIDSLNLIRKEGTDEFLIHFFFKCATAQMEKDIAEYKSRNEHIKREDFKF